jgi:hypothetical protein
MSASLYSVDEMVVTMLNSADLLHLAELALVTGDGGVSRLPTIDERLRGAVDATI